MLATLSSVRRALVQQVVKRRCRPAWLGVAIGPCHVDDKLDWSVYVFLLDSFLETRLVHSEGEAWLELFQGLLDWYTVRTTPVFVVYS